MPGATGLPGFLTIRGSEYPTSMGVMPQSTDKKYFTISVLYNQKPGL